MSDSMTEAAKLADGLRQSLRSRDSARALQMLEELIQRTGDPDAVTAVPTLLRALASGRLPQDDTVAALRALGLRRVAWVVEQHMSELIEAARIRLEPPDEDELPALD
ncbi:MAG: hypothetical protein IPM29_07460 [Planctomycetes bacterium]|nr:hypothetical protein [Planctomycetota bacterium]